MFSTESWRARIFRQIQRVGLPVSLLLGIVVLAGSVHIHYPIQEWLFWRYAGYWAMAIFFTVACASSGDAVVRRLFPRAPASERLVNALACGLLLFFLGMFVFGLFGLYGKGFFVAWPAALIALGGRRFYKFLWRFTKLWWAHERRVPLSVLGVAVTALGLLGIGIVYLTIMTPENVGYDSHWYHLPIAETYVAQGGVQRFVEGWYQGALPHLSSFVYAWAFMLPGARLFDQVELAAHLEFVILLWTLVGVSVLTRWALKPARRALHVRRKISPRSGRGAWAAVFLFPSIFLYDSSLIIGADHIAAFWSVPILLALARVLRAANARTGGWLALPLSGAMLTKYQAAGLVAGPALIVFLISIWRAIRARGDAKARIVALGSIAAAGLCSIILTSPHWLKNWLWYGDPLYPFLHRFLPARPWSADAALLFERVFKDQLWAPQGSFSDKLAETLVAVLTFSFIPHNWSTFHGKVPVFGSLFTLVLLPMAFLGKTARLWLISGCAYVGIFVWYWMSHQDRYLQALVPWMAAVVAATVVLAWSAGILVRALMFVLVGLQVVWGGDVFSFPTHAMLGTTPAKATIDLLSTGHRKDYAARWKVSHTFTGVAEHLQPGDKVLMHDIHVHLGLGAPSVLDWGPWQGGISYGRMRSPRAFYEKMLGYDVTHLYWRRESRGNDSLAGDLVFFTFAHHYTSGSVAADAGILAALPERVPPDSRWHEWQGAVLLCPGTYQPGYYQLGDLTVPAVAGRAFPSPRRRYGAGQGAKDDFRNARFVALEPGCHRPATKLRGTFNHVAQRGSAQLWIAKQLL